MNFDHETTLPSSVYREPSDVRPAWLLVGVLALGALVAFFVAVGEVVT